VELASPHSVFHAATNPFGDIGNVSILVENPEEWGSQDLEK